MKQRRMKWRRKRMENIFSKKYLPAEHDREVQKRHEKKAAHKNHHRAYDILRHLKALKFQKYLQ